MPILTNPFVKVVNQMNGIPTTVTGLEDMPELKARYKAREASLYISMQQVLSQVAELLAPDEDILSMMPMTNEENAGYATDGIMGMYAPQTQKAKDYIKSQSSLRGNRLMLFTNQRMIFFVVIEFIDDPTAYYSYAYDQIKAIAFKKHRMSIPGQKFYQRQWYIWYTLDFETPDRHIFNEVLTAANGELFRRNLLTIPGMSQIEIKDHMDRYYKRDNYLSSGMFWIKVTFGMMAFALLLALLSFLFTGNF